MSSLQDFAKEQFGIELTKMQLNIIGAWADDKQIIYSRRMGLTTANKVIKAYIKQALPPTHKSSSKKGVK